MKKYIYIDYENMGDLKELPQIDGKYFIFIGENQGKIPRQFVFPKGNKELIDIKGSGKNALDFHIVYFLAKNDDKEDVEHYVLSKDSGYDPIIAFCKKENKVVKRIISIDEIIDSKGNINETVEEYTNVYLDHLKKIDKKRYPKSEKGLKSDIKSALGKKLSEKQIEEVVGLLYKKRYIAKNEKNIIYTLPK